MNSPTLRTILVPHHTVEGQTSTIQVEEDFCNNCSNKSNYHFSEETSEEDIVLQDMGFITSGTIEY